MNGVCKLSKENTCSARFVSLFAYMHFINTALVGTLTKHQDCMCSFH